MHIGRAFAETQSGHVTLCRSVYALRHAEKSEASNPGIEGATSGTDSLRVSPSEHDKVTF